MPIIPQWTFEYKKLMLDYNRYVWRATHTIGCQFDLASEVSQAAKSSLQIMDPTDSETQPADDLADLEAEYSNPPPADLKKMQAQNSRSQRKNKMPHGCGRKSFSRKRNEMKIKTGKTPCQAEFLIESRKRSDGSFISEEAKTSKNVARLTEQVTCMTTFIMQILGTSTAEQVRTWATAFANLPNPVFANMFTTPPALANPTFTNMSNFNIPSAFAPVLNQHTPTHEVKGDRINGNLSG